MSFSAVSELQKSLPAILLQPVGGGRRRKNRPALTWQAGPFSGSGKEQCSFRLLGFSLRRYRKNVHVLVVLPLGRSRRERPLALRWTWTQRIPSQKEWSSFKFWADRRRKLSGFCNGTTFSAGLAEEPAPDRIIVAFESVLSNDCSSWQEIQLNALDLLLSRGSCSLQLGWLSQVAANIQFLSCNWDAA